MTLEEVRKPSLQKLPCSALTQKVLFLKHFTLLHVSSSSSFPALHRELLQRGNEQNPVTPTEGHCSYRGCLINVEAEQRECPVIRDLRSESSREQQSLPRCPRWLGKYDLVPLCRRPRALLRRKASAPPPVFSGSPFIGGWSQSA